MIKNKVLILLGDSPFRQQILPHVQRFLKAEENEVILFRVGERPQDVYVAQDPIFYTVDIFDQQAASKLTAQIRDEMLDVKQMLESAGYTVRREVRLGNAAAEIVRFIESSGIDLVAMTTRGRKGFSKFLYGSIAEHLIQHVTIPILLLRAAKSE